MRSPIAAAKPLTREQWDELGKIWESQGAYITQHDGIIRNDADDASIFTGLQRRLETTLNIRDNPLLVKAIEDIRDKYFILFNEQLQYDKSPAGGNKDALKRNVGTAMMIHTGESLKRMQLQDYGFTPQERDEILEKAGKKGSVAEGAGKPLPKEDAELILSKIIGRSIDSFEAISTFRHRAHVPHFRLSKGGVTAAIIM